VARIAQQAGLSDAQIRQLGRTLLASSTEPTAPAAQRTVEPTHARRYRGARFRPQRKTATAIRTEMQRDRAAEASRREVESLRFNAQEQQRLVRIAQQQSGAARRQQQRRAAGAARRAAAPSLQDLDDARFGDLEREVRERVDFVDAMRATGRLRGARYEEMQNEIAVRVSQMTSRARGVPKAAREAAPDAPRNTVRT
jgi:hypothetical protein